MDELRKQADLKLKELIEGKFYKQTEIAKALGISYMTLYNRRKNSDWTMREMNLILNYL